MCGVMLSVIIFVLDLFKFPVTLNNFMSFPSCINFIFGTVPYFASSCCCSMAAATPCCWSLTSCSSSSFAAAGSCCCFLVSSFSAYFSTITFNLSCPHPIFSIILLYNKETVSLTPYILSASALRFSTTGADTALYNFEIVFLKNQFIFINTFLRIFLKLLWAGNHQPIPSPGHINILLQQFFSLFSLVFNEVPTHQCDGCQVIGINCFSICTSEPCFW